MTDRPYYVLPPERDWPEETEARALALVTGANDDQETLAALSLLFRDPELTILRNHIYRWFTWRGDGRVQWMSLYDYAQGAEVESTQSQSLALIMLACSMASVHCPVRLGYTLFRLDVTRRAAFVDAMTYLCGGAE